MYVMDTIVKKEYTLTIYVDPDPENPRDWDTLGTLFIRHGFRGCGNMSDNEASLEDLNKSVVFLPVYFLDHSGYACSTASFNDSWDSWRAGTIYMTKEAYDTISEEDPDKKLKLAYDILRGEISTYDNYLRGDVYGYTIIEGDEEIDSCWGFYGDNGIEHIKEEFDATIKCRDAAKYPLFAWAGILDQLE